MLKLYGLGLTCKILALMCFCLLSLLFENTHLGLNAIQQFSVLCLIGTFFLLPIIGIKFKNELKLAKLKLYPARAFISIIAMITWIEAVKNLGSHESILVNYLTPIFAILLAGLFKEEKMHKICLMAGFSCLIIIGIALNPKIEISPYGFGMALFSTLLWAGYEVICKKQTHHEHFLIQAFYTLALSALFLSPISFGLLSQFTAYDYFILSSMACLRIANIILLFLAIKWATLNWLTPVSYMKFPIMAISGYLFLHKETTLTYWIVASLLVLINTLMVIIRKNKMAIMGTKKFQNI